MISTSPCSGFGIQDIGTPWKQGPLPLNTWHWGAVVPKGEETHGGFYFADFCGDHVKIVNTDRVLKSEEVAWYNNCIGLSPSGVGAVGPIGVK